ncbi:MAG: hypothetical protein K2H90_01325 [Oscillospiraceae bacterium]|nr:hypothetical protein [Oscillospiraceae bacterium]
MVKLSQENFIKARDYIFANGDDINRAWFSYLFEDNDTDKFLNVLQKYQHENGGFGGGIYYEFDYQGPCLKATEIAVKYILNLKEKPSANHPLIQNMMKYILGLYIPEIGNWGEVVVPEVNNGVHCYWVRFSGEDTTPIENEDERIKKYDANQKVCFAAFVSYYSELVPKELYSDIIKYPTEHILRYWDKNSPDYNKEIFDKGEPYDIEYFQWFVPCLKDKETADKLTSILCQNPTAFMELDFAKSDKDYVHLPCDVAGHPKSIIYPAVNDLVLDSLEYRMGQQKNDGRWPLGWSFGDDKELQKLQIKYETYRSLAMLEKLDRFDMIDR